MAWVNSERAVTEVPGASESLYTLPPERQRIRAGWSLNRLQFYRGPAPNSPWGEFFLNGVSVPARGVGPRE